jgi:hypothetical protein
MVRAGIPDCSARSASDTPFLFRAVNALFSVPSHIAPFRYSYSPVKRLLSIPGDLLLLHVEARQSVQRGELEIPSGGLMNGANDVLRQPGISRP